MAIAAIDTGLAGGDEPLSPMEYAYRVLIIPAQAGIQKIQQAGHRPAPVWRIWSGFHNSRSGNVRRM